MKRVRLRSVVIFTLAGLSGGLLLYTSQNVQQAERKLAGVENAIRQEEDSIRVLKAEWAYLNSPARLETLAAEYLDMKAPTPGQLVLSPSALPAPEIPTTGQELLHNVAQEAPPKPQVAPPLAAEPDSPPALPARKPAQAQKSFNQLIEQIRKEAP